MASETTFDHWKVVFSWWKVRKMPFSQNPFNRRLWSLGIQFYIHFYARKSKNLPWAIFFLLMHVLVPCVLAFCFSPNFYFVGGLICKVSFLNCAVSSESSIGDIITEWVPHLQNHFTSDRVSRSLPRCGRQTQTKTETKVMFVFRETRQPLIFKRGMNQNRLLTCES